MNIWLPCTPDRNMSGPTFGLMAHRAVQERYHEGGARTPRAPPLRSMMWSGLPAIPSSRSSRTFAPGCYGPRDSSRERLADVSTERLDASIETPVIYPLVALALVAQMPWIVRPRQRHEEQI
jgi:hypothetical protein